MNFQPLFLVLGLLPFAAVSRSAVQEPKRNVLFIAVDDLRPELGCYGAAHIKSPNVDRLAARGLLFERAYCQQAVCNPSRASVLSGCRPDTTRVMANNNFLRPMMPDVVTLPQHFKNNGWHTVSLGKIFHHSEKEPGDDPQSWSEPSWYHGEPHRHWFTNDRWRYTEWVNGKNESAGIELYDHQTDPAENVNIAGDSANKATVAELAKLLHDDWQAAKPADSH